MNELRVMTVNTKGGSRGKLPYYKHLIQTHDLDFLFLQETNISTNYKAQQFLHELGVAKGIFSLGSTFKGTAIILTSNRWEITRHMTDNIGGRIAIAEITNKYTTHTLVNIHAPAIELDRPNFYNTLANTLTGFKNIILGGDFNITLNDRDIVGTQIGTRRYGRAELQHIIDAHDLKDS